MSRGGTCFGMNKADNELETGVAVLVCCRRWLKSSILSRVCAGEIVFLVGQTCKTVLEMPFQSILHHVHEEYIWPM